MNHGSISLTLRFGAGLLCVAETSVFFADFGRFSVIFGPKLAVFIFFDKEEEVRFCSEFFYPGLWLAAHWLKRVSGASEQIEGVNKNC